jgi:hypothetical protein
VEASCDVLRLTLVEYALSEPAKPCEIRLYRNQESRGTSLPCSDVEVEVNLALLYYFNRSSRKNPSIYPPSLEFYWSFPVRRKKLPFPGLTLIRNVRIV